MTIRELRDHVAQLSPEAKISDSFERRRRPDTKGPKVWYRTQQEHLLGWLDGYDGPGAYGRRRWDRDARFVYNHFQCPQGLLWLAEAAGVAAAKIREANEAVLSAPPRLSSQVGALRRVIPWSLVEEQLTCRDLTPKTKQARSDESDALIASSGTPTSEDEARFDAATAQDFPDFAGMPVMVSKLGPGLTDLSVTFSKANLPMPPIPTVFNGSIIRQDSWVWSTRAIDPMGMYMFGDYLDEALAGPVENYLAISHAGHGLNSYGLNYHLAYGPLVIFTQNGWGGAYGDSEADTERVATTFKFVASLIALTDALWPDGQQMPDDQLIVAYSDFRGVAGCCLRSKGARTSERRTALHNVEDLTLRGDSLECLQTKASAALKKLAASNRPKTKEKNGTKTPQRHIIVGDVHGELTGLKEILTHAGLIDVWVDWSGKDAVLVQTGDVIDRGPHSVEAVQFLRRLQAQAMAAGGRVLRLCGNHELMLLQGNFKYADFDNPAELRQQLKEEILAGKLLAAYTDGTRLYTHAGLRTQIRIQVEDEATPSSKPSRLKNLSDRLNQIFFEAVKTGDLRSHPIFQVDKSRGGSDEVGGIFWGSLPLLERSELAYDIPQVFGHTPTRKDEVRQSRGVRLINIDAGMCLNYGGKRVYLEIDASGSVVEHALKNKRWHQTVLPEMNRSRRSAGGDKTLRSDR